MEIILYSNKQILGGFLLMFIIGLLFVINLTLSTPNNNINLSYFISPLIFSVTIMSIFYVKELKKSIETTKNRYVFSDTFNIKNCPTAYIKNEEDSNIICSPDASFGSKCESYGSKCVSYGSEGSDGSKCVSYGSEGSDSSKCESYGSKTFMLNGDDTYCKGSINIDINGCFNKFPNRNEKCNKIKNFMKNHQKVLDNWSDFTNECPISYKNKN
jgi:hypothetical protein